MITFEEYKKQIIANMVEVETYKPEFLETVNALAQIYVDRDTARKQFEESGGLMIVEHTNKSGATNLAKNPYYSVIENLEANILMYNRELGLTPKGLKAIDDKKMNTKKKKSKLEAALEKVGQGDG